MKTPNREELAWAAGFYDGEGCTGARIQGSHYYLSMTIGQKDRRALDKFHQAILGEGTVNGKDGIRCNWRASGIHAQAVLAMIWPFLGEVKREQAYTAAMVWKNDPRRRWRRWRIP